MEIIAYSLDDPTGWILEPASPQREWMDEFGHGFAYRCMPLTAANQMGWVVRCPVGLLAMWDKENDDPMRCVQIRFDRDEDRWASRIKSHFGRGTITFNLPWIFRTPPGIGLIVRGPTNGGKASAAPLDAYVETDWSVQSFTMNWRFLKPGVAVRFEEGEPICLLLPFARDLLSGWSARSASIETNPELKAKHFAWAEERKMFMERSNPQPKEWQKHYVLGVKAEEQVMRPTIRWNLPRFRDAEMSSFD